MAITCQPVEAMQTYAASATYREPIPSAKIDAGVIPLDSLPADWWNWLWYNITLNEGRTVSFLNAVFSEITSVYTAAGITPSSVNTDDLKKAIEKMCQVVATGVVPGSVLSSTLSGKLAVAGDGTATINGLGTPSSLQTTADNVVAAINEVLASVSDRAPTNHASTECIYGIGSSAVSGSAVTRTYGHVSLSCCINPLLICPSFGSNYLTGMAYSAADARNHINCPAQCTSTECVAGSNCKSQMGHVTVMPGCGLGISGGVLSLNAPGYNCVGNVTKVCFNGTAYTPTSGVINLGSITGFPGYGTSTSAWSTAAQAGTSTLVARADHSHGCPWSNCTSVAIGCSASTGTASCSTALGAYAQASYGCAVAIGNNARALGTYGTAVGSNAHVLGTVGTAMGSGATACSYSIAIGCYAHAAGECSMALGRGTRACCTQGIALGYTSCALGECTIAIGTCTTVTGTTGIAIGYDAKVDTPAGIAVGHHALSGCCKSVRWSMIKTSPVNGTAFVTVCSSSMECDIQAGLRAFWDALTCTIGYSVSSSCPQMCAPIQLAVVGTFWMSTCRAWNVSGNNVDKLLDIMHVNGANAACPMTCNKSCRIRIGSWDWTGGTHVWPYGLSLQVMF